MGRLTLAFIADVLSHEREQKQAKEAAKAEKKADESAKEGKPVPSATVSSAQTCCILRRLCHQENLSTLASKASISACELFEVGALFNFIVVFFITMFVCACVRARVCLCVCCPLAIFLALPEDQFTSKISAFGDRFFCTQRFRDFSCTYELF